jgi:hypothetical protein
MGHHQYRPAGRLGGVPGCRVSRARPPRGRLPTNARLGRRPAAVALARKPPDRSTQRALRLLLAGVLAGRFSSPPGCGRGVAGAPGGGQVLPWPPGRLAGVPGGAAAGAGDAGGPGGAPRGRHMGRIRRRGLGAVALLHAQRPAGEPAQRRAASPEPGRRRQPLHRRGPPAIHHQQLRLPGQVSRCASP